MILKVRVDPCLYMSINSVVFGYLVLLSLQMKKWECCQ